MRRAPSGQERHLLGVPASAATEAGTEQQVEQPEQPGRSTRSLVLAWGRRVVVLAVVLYVGYQLIRGWPEVVRTLAVLPWPRLVLSCAAVTGGVLLGPVIWRAMVTDVGEPVPVPDAAKIYLVGQLGKYVPGSVMAFVMQVELARTVGVSRTRGMTASVLTAGIAVVTSLLTGALAIPAFLHSQPRLLWLFLLLPIGLVLIHPSVLTTVINRLLALLRRGPLARRLSWRAISVATGVSLLTYVLYGAHLYALLGALPHERNSAGGIVFLLCVGGIGLAMTAGLVAFILPSGIGAREVVIVAALGAVVPYGQALALAVVSRLMFTVVELVTAGVAAAFAQWSRAARRQPDAVG